MLISFLITAYNLEEWMLRRCIDSVLAQGLPISDFEVIVVDDGSEKPVAPLLRQYASENFIVHRQENGGPGAARNKALELASGTYILFVDGDDYLFRDSIVPLTHCLKQEKPDILHFSFRHCSESAPVRISFAPITYRHYESGSHFMLAHHLTGCNWLQLFRLDLVRHHGLCYPVRLLHEDEEFITKLFFFAQKVIATDHPVYAYYFRRDSIVHHPSEEQVSRRLRNFLTVAKRLQEFAGEQKPIASPMQQEALQRKIDFLGVDFLLKTLRTDQPEHYLRTYLPQLKQMKLFPPAPRREGWSYRLFQLLAPTVTGRRILQLLDRYRTKKF